MHTLKELLDAQRAILERARRERRAMLAPEMAEFDRLQEEVDSKLRAGDAGGADAAPQEGGQDPAPDAAPEPAQGSGADAAPEAAQDGGERGAAERAREEGAMAERARARSIEEMCRDLGIDPAGYVERGLSVDAARAAIIEGMRRDKAPLGSAVRVGESGADRFARDASDALLIRSGVGAENPSEDAGKLAGMSLRQMFIEAESIRGNGEGLGRLSGDELFQRAFFNPESAFPAILDQTIEKAYVQGHRKVPVTFDRFTKKGSLSDFKTHDNNYVAGPVGEFLEVPESGELKHDSFGDARRPTRKLKTYGRQFTLSRKAFIDDDISLVTSLPARYAASARKTINRQVYQILVDNPAVYDGAQLFGAAHKNSVKEGTGVTQEALQTMILALSSQVDEFGEAVIIRPAQLVVPAGLRFDMYTIFNSPYVKQGENAEAVNPLYQYRDAIEIVEDPTLNVLAAAKADGEGKVPWFLVGDASDTDFIEVDYLNGQEIPTIRRSEAPGQLGFVWDIWLDWGISVMDFRGAVRNPGAKIESKLDLES